MLGAANRAAEIVRRRKVLVEQPFHKLISKIVGVEQRAAVLVPLHKPVTIWDRRHMAAPAELLGIPGYGRIGEQIVEEELA